MYEHTLRTQCVSKYISLNQMLSFVLGNFPSHSYKIM